MKASKAPLVKLPKGVSQEFVDGIQAMTTDQLKALIVTLQVQAQENDLFKESEGYVKSKEAFDAAKQKHDLVANPVKDTAVSIRNRTKLIVKRLQEKGGA